MTEDAIPDGTAVERLAMIMASALGAGWSKAPAEFKKQMRIAANAALLDKAIQGEVHVLARLKDRLEGCVDVQRAAATKLDGSSANEELVQALYQGAFVVSTLLGVLDGQSLEEPEADAGELPAPDDEQGTERF